MKLIIEIDNSIYGICKSVRNLPLDENDIMSSLIMQSIANSTPLEKHDEEVIKETVASIWGKPPCDNAISRADALVSIKNLYPDMPIVNIMGARQKWLEKYAPYFECENAIEQLSPVYPQNTDVLDKIRAEIEALPKTYPFINHIDTYVKEDDVKKIIDKYRKGDKE